MRPTAMERLAIDAPYGYGKTRLLEQHASCQENHIQEEIESTELCSWVAGRLELDMLRRLLVIRKRGESGFAKLCKAAEHFYLMKDRTTCRWTIEAAYQQVQCLVSVERSEERAQTYQNIFQTLINYPAPARPLRYRAEHHPARHRRVEPARLRQAAP